MKPASCILVVSVAALAAALSASVQAQTIYRCGNEYTRVPCPNGKPLETSDTRSAAQRAEARAMVNDQRRLAAEMERDRRRDEAAVKPALATSLGPAKPAAPAASAASSTRKVPPRSVRHKPKADEQDKDFVAAVPGSGKKKTSPR